MDLAGKLYQAVSDGDEAAARQLLAAGAQADLVNRNGRVPLHATSWVHRMHAGVARLLLEAAPATAAVADSYGQTPLHYAAMEQSWEAPAAPEMVRLLLAAAPETALMVGRRGKGKGKGKGGEEPPQA